MRIVACAVAALTVAACAGTPVPNARPLSASQIAAISPTQVAVTANNTGVAKAWFSEDSSAAGVAYGPIGTMAFAVLDAFMNYGPGKGAQDAADELATVMSPEDLNASLVQAFRSQIPATADADAVTVSDVITVQKIIAPGVVEDALEVAVSYTLSEDASTLRLIVTASYENPQIPYQTPYTFEGSIPRAETTGPTYRNSFTYYSGPLQIPSLTPELRARLIASIEESSRDENGTAPVEGSDAHKAMMKELEEVGDDRLTLAEITIFLTREWTRNDGELLKAEVESAHAYAVRYAILDINRTAVPSLEGTDEVVETMADGRIITRVGAGLTAGSYISTPGSAASIAGYGNTITIARSVEARNRFLNNVARAVQQLLGCDRARNRAYLHENGRGGNLCDLT